MLGYLHFKLAQKVGLNLRPQTRSIIKWCREKYYSICPHFFSKIANSSYLTSCTCTCPEKRHISRPHEPPTIAQNLFFVFPSLSAPLIPVSVSISHFSPLQYQRKIIGTIESTVSIFSHIVALCGEIPRYYPPQAQGKVPTRRTNRNKTKVRKDAKKKTPNNQ